MNEKMAVMVNGKVTMGNGINFMEDTVEESWEWNDGMVCSDGFNGDVTGNNSIVIVCVCVYQENGCYQRGWQLLALWYYCTTEEQVNRLHE